MLLRSQRPPLARRGGVSLDGRDTDAEGAGDLDGGHAPFFGFDDLLPEVQRVGVHGRILPHRPTTLQDALIARHQPTNARRESDRAPTSNSSLMSSWSGTLALCTLALSTNPSVYTSRW